MKKIFAVLISMIFILSTLGVAAANGGCNCDRPNVIAPKTVTVGQEFVFLYKVECGSRNFY